MTYSWILISKIFAARPLSPLNRLLLPPPLAYSSAFIVFLKIARFLLPALDGYQYWYLTVNRRFVSVMADYRSVYTNSRSGKGSMTWFWYQYKDISRLRVLHQLVRCQEVYFIRYRPEQTRTRLRWSGFCIHKFSILAGSMALCKL